MKIVKIVGWILFAILLFLFIGGVTLYSHDNDKDALFFGKRFQAVQKTDADNCPLKEGWLCIITPDMPAAAGETVSYVDADGKIKLCVQTYSIESGNIIGKVTGYVPVLGGVFHVVGFTTAITSATLILTVALFVFLHIFTNNKGGAVKVNSRRRIGFETFWFALTNSYAVGFIKGTIYTGKFKSLCVPGLNCYSCPGATGACPVGALQATLTKRQYTTNANGDLVAVPTNYIAYYVVGFLILVGALCGRLVCGFLCPFGWIQELLNKIPLPKRLKIRTFPGDKYLRYVKYAVLAVLVIALPLALPSVFPWFCKLLCPSGMLIGGIPLMSVNDGLRAAAGSFTILKLSILAAILILSVFIYRPFCKYLCPLGAIYGFFNRYSLYGHYINKEECTNCGACKKVCKMNVDVTKTPNSSECIRCGDCVAACPSHAIKNGFGCAKSGKKTDKIHNAPNDAA